MIRDGRDVAASFAARTNWGLTRGAERWVADNRAAMQWFADPRTLVVRYEDLAADPVPTMSRVFSFIGEGFDPV